MSTPKPAPYTVLPVWATTPGYPPGVQDWAASPTKQPPVANNFVPEEEFPAQHANYLVNGLTIADVGAKVAADALYNVSRNRDVHTWSGAGYTRHGTDVTTGMSDLSWDTSEACWRSTQYSAASSIQYTHPVGGGRADVAFRKAVELAPYNNCEVLSGQTYASNAAGQRVLCLYNSTLGDFGFRYTLRGGSLGSAQPSPIFISFPAPFNNFLLGSSNYVDCFWSDSLACFVFFISYISGTTSLGVFTYDPATATLTDLTASCLPFATYASSTAFRMYHQEFPGRVVLAFGGGNVRTASVAVLTSATAATTVPIAILASGAVASKVVGLAKAGDALHLLTVQPTGPTFQFVFQRSVSYDAGATWTIGATTSQASILLSDIHAFGNVGEVLWFQGTVPRGPFKMLFASMDLGLTWEPVPGSVVDVIAADTFIGYTPKLGGMIAVADRTHFKSTLPSMLQPTFTFPF
jgi:hypothetical protein